MSESLQRDWNGSDECPRTYEVMMMNKLTNIHPHVPPKLHSAEIAAISAPAQLPNGEVDTIIVDSVIGVPPSPSSTAN